MNIEKIIKGIEEPVMALLDRVEAQGLDGIWYVQHDNEVWGSVAHDHECLLTCRTSSQAYEIAMLGPEGLKSIFKVDA